MVSTYASKAAGIGSFCCHQYLNGEIEWYIVTEENFRGRCITQIHDKSTEVAMLGGLAFVDDDEVPAEVVALLTKRKLLGEIK